MDDIAGLRDFKIPLNKIAPLTEFTTRRGDVLAYRFYPAWCDNLLMLVHGLAGDSRYLGLLAHTLAEAGVASVVTPDLRGHGPRPHHARAALEAPGQLEEDLEELLIHVRMKTPASRLVWAGHSFGAGLALRLTLAGPTPWQSGLWMIAPYLPGPQARTEDFGGWLSEEKDFLRVNMPTSFLSGSEVLEYDRRFLEAAIPPKDFASRMMALGMKTEVLLGTQDRVCPPARARGLLTDWSTANIREVEASHMGLVGRPAALTAAIDAVSSLFS